MTGKKDLKKSTNLWDWLSNGVYFWEQNPSRAWEYASENSRGDQFNKTKIVTPFVLGAIVELGTCLNLIDQEGIQKVEEAYKGLEKPLKRII